MRAMKCDRCGKLYEHYDGRDRFKNTEKSNSLILTDKDLELKYWSRKSYDLCPDCMEGLGKFLSNERSEGEKT